MGERLGYMVLVQDGSTYYAGSHTFPTYVDAKRYRKRKYGDRLGWQIVEIRSCDEQED